MNSPGFGSLSDGGNAPLPPVLLLPAPATGNLPIKLEAVPVALNVPAHDVAVAWLGKVSSEPQFNCILDEQLSQGSNLSFSDLPDGKYYLKVRAKDKKSLESYDATHEININARPFALKVVAPAQATTGREANPELTWTKIEQANEYLLELGRDVDFKQLLDSRRVPSTAYKIEKNLELGQYFWRLASIDSATDKVQDQSPYAAASSFTYKAKPNTPDISQLEVKVLRNRVYVSTINSPEGLVYEAVLQNEVNKQANVRRATGLNGEFNFLLYLFHQIIR